jgi:hypothetical protein
MKPNEITEQIVEPMKAVIALSFSGGHQFSHRAALPSEAFLPHNLRKMNALHLNLGLK